MHIKELPDGKSKLCAILQFSFSGAHSSAHHCRDGEPDTTRQGEIFPDFNRREGALSQSARSSFQGALCGHTSLQ